MGSVKFGTSPLPTEINLNYSKADGEKEWVGDQTSIIAKEGGTIESKNFTNSGAIIGSESKENKLIVKADNVNVDNLKDKDNNKVSGGGINITNKGVPNISVITGGQDKRQDTNATAVNTEFIVQGENKSAEELGFNTDLNKAQVITKDENKVLDADLHTDLLDKDERDKIVEAGEKLGNLAEAIINSNDGGIGNTYKENRFGNLFNKYVSEQKEKLNILGDPNISEIDKRNVLNDIVKDFLLSKGYKGEMPQILIGDKTEATDIRYNGKEYVFISKEDLNSSNILSILGHELGHMNTYDIDEETAEKIESKVDTKVDQSDTNGKYNTYLKELQEKYKDLPDEEEAKEFQKNIPDEYKESFNPVIMAILTWITTSEESGDPIVTNSQDIEKVGNKFYYTDKDNKYEITKENIMKDGTIVIPIETLDYETNVIKNLSKIYLISDLGKKFIVKDVDKRLEVEITNDIIKLPKKGSALKLDRYHNFNKIVDNYAGEATKFDIPNGKLYQLDGSLNKVNGRFEWIIQDGHVTHRLFVPNGTINGVPIKP